MHSDGLTAATFLVSTVTIALVGALFTLFVRWLGALVEALKNEDYRREALIRRLLLEIGEIPGEIGPAQSQSSKRAA